MSSKSRERKTESKKTVAKRKRKRASSSKTKKTKSKEPKSRTREEERHHKNRAKRVVRALTNKYSVKELEWLHIFNNVTLKRAWQYDMIPSKRIFYPDPDTRAKDENWHRRLDLITTRHTPDDVKQLFQSIDPTRLVISFIMVNYPELVQEKALNYQGKTEYKIDADSDSLHPSLRCSKRALRVIVSEDRCDEYHVLAEALIQSYRNFLPAMYAMNGIRLPKSRVIIVYVRMLEHVQETEDETQERELREEQAEAKRREDEANEQARLDELIRKKRKKHRVDKAKQKQKKKDKTSLLKTAKGKRKRVSKNDSDTDSDSNGNSSDSNDSDDEKAGRNKNKNKDDREDDTDEDDDEEVKSARGQEALEQQRRAHIRAESDSDEDASEQEAEVDEIQVASIEAGADEEQDEKDDAKRDEDEDEDENQDDENKEDDDDKDNDESDVDNAENDSGDDDNQDSGGGGGGPGSRRRFKGGGTHRGQGIRRRSRGRGRGRGRGSGGGRGRGGRGRGRGRARQGPKASYWGQEANGDKKTNKTVYEDLDIFMLQLGDEMIRKSIPDTGIIQVSLETTAGVTIVKMCLGALAHSAAKVRMLWAQKHAMPGSCMYTDPEMMFELFGIHGFAASQRLELSETMSDVQYITPCHIDLLVKRQSFHGSPIPMTNKGLAVFTPNPLDRLTYDGPVENIREACEQGRQGKIEGLTGKLIVGQRAPIGVEFQDILPASIVKDEQLQLQLKQDQLDHGDDDDKSSTGSDSLNFILHKQRLAAIFKSQDDAD